MRKVLIVDDNQMSRMLLRNMLHSDYDILEAENGETALDVMRQSCDTLSAVLMDVVMPVMGGYETLTKIRGDAGLMDIPVIIVTGNEDEESRVTALSLGANDFVIKPFSPDIIKHCLKNNIALREAASKLAALQRDKLTGLYTREVFFEKAAELIAEHEPGYYVMSCFDVDSFKVVNDQFGTDIGDRVLRHIADTFRKGFEPEGGICCRISADNFAVLYPHSLMDSEQLKDISLDAGSWNDSAIPVRFSIGRYIVDDLSLPISSMYDRAILAEEAAKGRYDTNYVLYDESMRETLLHEQKTVSEMKSALETGQFEVWLQPQYSHASGALIGAEALVRWRRPDGEITPPGDFIPVFEKNGFIYELDRFVWEQSCKLIRKWLDEGRNPMPISVNVSRYDMFREDFFGIITGLVEAYAIPVSHLRLEITETAFAKATEQIIGMVRSLIDYGFTVEIDDFGSGYSSLNTLKDVPAQILKLDMRFLEGTGDTKRSGNILESVVRMAKWLGMAVIAEGVETREQADYLKSIGCYYVQGYLYARPMPAADYEALAKSHGKEEKLIVMQTVETLDNSAFWDPKSMDTLIFNSFVGGACIFEYHNENAEILRVNESFVRESGIHFEDDEPLSALDLYQYMDENGRADADACVKRAIETGTESSVETRLNAFPGRLDSAQYLRCTLRVIANAGDYFLVYCVIYNITQQRQAEKKERAMAEQLSAIMANIDGGVTATVLRDGKLKYLFTNDRYFELIGCTREDYETRFSGELITVHPDDRDRVKAVVARAYRENRGYSVDYRILRPDGELRWLRSIVSLMEYPGVDEPVSLAVVSDITEQHEVDQRQHELLDNLPCGAGIYEFKDGQMSLAYQNKSYWELVGLSEASFPDSAPMSAIHPEDIPIVMQELASAIEQNRDVSCDIRLRHLTKDYQSVHLVGRILHTKSGGFLIYATFTPITEQKKLEQAQREAVEQLQFLNDTAHSLLSQPDIELGINGTLRKLMEYFKGKRAYIFEFNFERETADNTYEVCADGVSAEKNNLQELPLTLFDFWFQGFEQHGFYSVTDVSALDESRAKERETLRAQGIVSLFATPLYRDGKLIGTIGVDDPLRQLAHLERLLALGDYLAVMLTRRDYEERLKSGAKAHEQMMQDMPGGYAKMHISNTGIVSVFLNDEFCRMCGMTYEQTLALYETDAFAGVHPEDMEYARSVINNAIKNRTTLSLRLRLANGKGGYTPMQVFYRVTEDEGGLYLNGYYSDATEMNLAEEQRRELFENLPCGAGIFEIANDEIHIAYLNRQYREYLKREIGNLSTTPVFEVVHPDDVDKLKAALREALTGNKDGTCDVRIMDGIGGFIPFHMVGRIMDRTLDKASLYVTCIPLTEKDLLLRRRAETDGMTGIYNKATAESLIRERLASERGVPCAMMIVDVDNLKTINDSMGHQQGDRAICVIADTLKAQFRKTDIIGRIGGDEFVVFLEGIEKTDRLRHMAAEMQQSLFKAADEETDDHPVHISIGIVVSTAGEATFEELYSHADKALYEAKRNGKNQYYIYSLPVDGKAAQHNQE